MRFGMNSVIYSLRPVALAAYSTSREKTNRGSEIYKDRHCLSLVVARLRDIRQARGVSLREVSRRAHVAEDVLDLAESGKRIPSSRTFKAWCRALHLSWDQVWWDSLDY
jgi:DNA-binding XRE family transcriptional regulator